MHRIDGAGATVDNKFTEGDPVGGAQATVVTDDWLNDVQEELMSILAAGSVSPVKGTQNQVLQAIRGLSAGVVGSTVNLKMTVAAASSTATITADEVVVKSGLSGRTWTIGGFNKLLNLANAGALGMDSLPAPANGWLAIYAGLNETTGATTAFAQSLGNTVAPAVYGGSNVPTGVTATALLAVVPTNASSQFKIIKIRNRKATLQSVVTAYSGNSIGTFNPSLSAFIPANAVSIFGELTLSNTSSSSMSMTVASDATLLFGQQNRTALISSTADTSNFSNVEVTTPQQVSLITSSSAGTPFYALLLSGWEI